jgi:dihydroorotase-like cyclic amidohydrolase
METIISACISAGVTLVVCLINNHGQQEKTRALLEYKLEELTKRVDKHNNVIDRTYRLEKAMEVQEERIKVANHRIDDLEGEKA